MARAGQDTRRLDGYPKGAAIIRVRIRRRVIRIQVHVAIVPIPAEADGTDRVRINEVGVNCALRIPFNYSYI